MRPVEPIIPGATLPVTVYAKNQPEYTPLPCFRYNDDQGTVLIRWHLAWRERIKLLLTGNIYHTMLTFNKPLTPQHFDVNKPQLEVRELRIQPTETELA